MGETSQNSSYAQPNSLALNVEIVFWTNVRIPIELSCVIHNITKLLFLKFVTGLSLLIVLVSTMNTNSTLYLLKNAIKNKGLKDLVCLKGLIDPSGKIDKTLHKEALLYSAKLGKLEVFEHFDRQFEDNYPIDEVLRNAVIGNQIPIIDYLLKQSNNLFFRHRIIETSLIHAAHSNFIELLYHFKQKKIKLGREGSAALYCCTFDGHIEFARILIALGIEPTQDDLKYALLNVIRRKDLELVKILNTMFDCSKINHIVEAATHGSLEITRYYMKLFPLPLTDDAEGLEPYLTAFVMSCYSDNNDNFKYLIELMYPRILTIDKIINAISQRRHERETEKLGIEALNYVADIIDLPYNFWGGAELPYIIAERSRDLALAFINHGADVTFGNNDALVLAVEYDENIEVVKRLVQRGADITINRFLPLFIAIESNSINNLKYMVTSLLNQQERYNWEVFMLHALFFKRHQIAKHISEIPSFSKDNLWKLAADTEKLHYLDPIIKEDYGLLVEDALEYFDRAGNGYASNYIRKLVCLVSKGT